MDVIYHEISLGRWAGIPPLRFAQTITSGDDPFILLDTPTPQLIWKSGLLMRIR